MARFATPAEITIGVIGYGGAFNMGKSHLQQMQKAGMTPVAVCEIDPERLKVAQDDFPGIETYSSVDELLNKSKVNLITIITPHNSHAELALKALKAGKHVCCEKPLAITTQECDDMIAAAKANNVVITTYHNRHWDGCILTAVEKIQAGEIGEVMRLEAHMGSFGQPKDWWRTSKSISGGILYDWGVHLLEYSLQILGPDAGIQEVSGYAKNGYWAPKTKWLDDTNEDEAEAVVRFTNGTWLSLRISQLMSNPRPGVVEIFGTKGVYVMNHGDWTIIQPGDPHVTRTGKNKPGEAEKYYQNVADHLVKGDALIITGEWSRRPIHILDLAHQSAKKGMAVAATYR